MPLSRGDETLTGFEFQLGKNEPPYVISYNRFALRIRLPAPPSRPPPRPRFLALALVDCEDDDGDDPVAALPRRVVGGAT